MYRVTCVYSVVVLGSLLPICLPDSRQEGRVTCMALLARRVSPFPLFAPRSPLPFRQPHQEYKRGHRPGLIFFSPPMIPIQLPSKTYPASLRTLPMFSEHEMMSHSPFPATWQPTIKAYPRHRPMNIRPKTLGSNMFAREKLATRNVPSYNKDPSPGQHLWRQLIRAVLEWHLGMYRVLSRPSA